MAARAKRLRRALAGATPYLRYSAMPPAVACWPSRRSPPCATGDGAAGVALTRFFAETVAVQAAGLERSVAEGGEGVRLRASRVD